MSDHIDLQIIIRDKGQIEHIEMYVKENSYHTLDYIEIEIDLAKAMTLISLLFKAVSKILASEH